VTPTFEEFAAARTAALLRYAHVLTGSPQRAQDLVQDALAGAWRRWDRISDGSPEGYVRTSILHGYLGSYRRTGRWETLSSAPPDEAVEDHSEAAVDRAAVVGALAQLPPRMRAVLVLRFYEDMTEKQAAAAMGISVGAVKSATARALGKLRTDPALSKETVR
jgi:RNA polymerase sigma-70 factor (sigma-E family)